MTKKNKNSTPRLSSTRIRLLASKRLKRSTKSLLELFSEPNPKLKRTEYPDDSEIDKYVNRLKNAAEALNIWHTLDFFLDPDGTPKSLPQSGEISLFSLATHICETDKNRRQLVDDLISLGFVKSHRRSFTPKQRSAVIGTNSALALSYGTTTIAKLVDTMRHNFSGGSPPRLEKQVAEARIREGDLPLFLRFASQQGQAFIDSMDDWLSQNCIKKQTGTKTVSVSAGAFAWSDQLSDRPIKPIKPRGGTRSRR